MILDAHRDVLPAELQAGIVIVGSGAAGITLARELIGRGQDVLLLEAGGEAVRPESQDFYRTAAVSPVTHHLGHEFRRRGWGGTTSLWGGRCIPLEPIDFEVRDWIPHSGWPIPYDAVARFYPAALSICDAGPDRFTADSRLFAATSPDLVLDRIERFSLPTDFGKRYRDALAAASDVRVLMNAPVVEIMTDPAGNATTGVEIIVGGQRRHVAAKTVVLAAGGLETTRLLLASRRARATGLGNERDLVGRFYQTHLEGNFGLLTLPRDARIGYWQDPDGVYVRHYLQLAPAAQRRLQAGQVALRPHYPAIADPSHRNAILSAMYFAKSGLVPEYARIIAGAGGGVPERVRAGTIAAHLRNIVLGAPRIAWFGVDWLRHRSFATRKLPSVVLTHREGRYPVNLNAEQVPNPDSRLMLADETDAHGVPRLAIDWRLSDTDRMLLSRGLTAISAAMPAGTGFEVADLSAAIESVTPISHHMGTARMADDPRTGVVDPNLELFGTKGVYVCGAAAFPTSGFANPTLTIVALALRLAERLAAR